ncbi:MAG: TIR domain-containing protein [Lachnospiraceae bacterium]|nr:TIR domain-containing protein [Lachnospiraceae bacterium]
MGVVDNSSTWSANDWEEVRYKSDTKIKEWIDAQMAKRSCVVVLIGSETSSRKWVKYEIEKAYELEKGIVGVYIHNLKDSNGNQSSQGANPFYGLSNKDGHRLSNYIECYNPPHSTSTFVYDDIKENLSGYIERAIANSGTY